MMEDKRTPGWKEYDRRAKEGLIVGGAAILLFLIAVVVLFTVAEWQFPSNQKPPQHEGDRIDKAGSWKEFLLKAPQHKGY
jgi:hypothetical protein